MENNRYIKVLLKEPGNEPKVITIENTLKSIQNIVKEPIEFIYHNGAFIAHNEEGKIKKLEPNLVLEKELIYGSFLIIGNNKAKDDFISLTRKQIEEFKKEIINEMEKENELEYELE